MPQESDVPQSVALVPLPQRDPSVTVSQLVDLYMAHYAGRDPTRPQRLRFWQEQIGTLTLADLDGDEDRVAAVLDGLAQRHGLHFAGVDATGHKIMRAKSKPLADSTVNRYAAAIASVLGWSQKKRITP